MPLKRSRNPSEEDQNEQPNKTQNFNDEEYFTSYEDMEIHRLMINDEPRTLSYKKAIMENVHMFKNRIVMDVGAGSGILSLFAASAGAKRVYAIEASGLAPLISKVVKDNRLEEIITVIHDKVENVDLPENQKVDIIISEWMGFYLLHESMLNSVLYARDKFLAEDGRMFPSEARLYASPCSIHQLWDNQIHFWDKVHGYNMSALGSYALKAKQTKPEVCIVKPEYLLAKPVCFKTMNLRWMDISETSVEPDNVFVSVEKCGSYHGICIWFECDFDGVDYDVNGKEFGKLITLSTSPEAPITHWKQTVIMVGENNLNYDDNIKASEEQNENGINETSSDSQQIANYSKSEHKTINNSSKNIIELENDEIIGWCLSLKQSEENSRHYAIELQMLDPETDEHPEPCNCGMARCAIIAKIIEKELNGEDILGGD